MKMKIGFDFRMGGSINAGIGRYVFELLKNILKQDSENTYYVFYHPQNTSARDIAMLREFANVQIVSAPYRHYSIAEQLLFPRLLYKYNLDLVHFPNFNVPVTYRRPYVVTIHDMVHHKISGHKKSRLIYFYGYKYVIQQAAIRAQKIITVSEAAKKDIIELLQVPTQKVSVIYEAPFLPPGSEADVEKVKKQYLLKAPYFLFVGTLERKKNIIGLAKGFQRFLIKYRLNMDLVIAGKSDKHYPNIKFEVLKAVDPDRIVFTGFVSDSSLAALYRGAFAFATASLHEGFGLPGVEAMQFGLPVLASDTEVLNEVYDNAAIYFDPLNPEDIADKMQLVSQDGQFYKQMQDRGLARYALFSWERTAQETLALYKDAISSADSVGIGQEPGERGRI
jgi:glycosyltransferase involved in cell wall biosynthesis